MWIELSYWKPERALFLGTNRHDLAGELDRGIIDSVHIDGNGDHHNKRWSRFDIFTTQIKREQVDSRNSGDGSWTHFLWEGEC